MFFGKLKIKDRPMFKGITEFDFGRVGLTVVHGLNTNNAVSSSNNTNAVGKSMLFGTLQDLLYREVLIGSRLDRITTGSVSLQLGKTRGDLYRLVSKNKDLAILKPGSGDLLYREKSEVEALVKSIVPQSLVAYATLCHLDDRVPHPLIRGETAARREFFTKFFELDSTDNRLKLVSARIAEAKASARLLADKKSRLAKLPEDPTDLKALKASIQKLESKKESFQKRMESYSEHASLRYFLEEHKEDLQEVVPDLATLRSKLKRLEGVLEAIDEDSIFQAELGAWRKQSNAYKEFISKHLVRDNESESLLSKVVELTGLQAELKRFKESVAGASEELAGMPAPESLVAEFNCDTCGAELTGKLKRKHAERHEERLSSYQDKIKAVKARGRQAKAKTVELESSVGKFPSMGDMQARLSLLRSSPSVPRKPVKSKDGAEDVDLPERSSVTLKIKATRDILDKFNWATGKLYSQALAIEDVDTFIAEPDPTQVYMSTVERLSALNLDYTVAKKEEDERATLQEEIAEAEEEGQNAAALEILEKAYGPRGFRRVLINTVCHQLEGILNRYAKMIYPEDMVFSLEMDRQFHILVTRKHKGQDLTSDVRKLSGAESSMFSILLWCGLMSFVPKALRPNILILDELDARLGEEFNERFLLFIPKMLKVVEHVIVVTPKLETRYEDYVPDVQYLTVVKRGMESRITPGKATDQKLTSKKKDRVE